MKKQKYSQVIDAPRERVWEVMWNEDTYAEWTAPFAEGSQVKTDWQEGSRILFLNGEGEGMVAKIEVKKKPETMIFRHLGMIDKEGKEDTVSEQVKAWAGAKEAYNFSEEDGKTRLEVEMDVDEGHLDFFSKTWPKALQVVKDLAE